MVLSTSDTCIVSGDLSLMNTGQISFDQMENNDNTVSVGDQIVTSYISDKYLQGILIGSVSEINVDSNNLTRSGYITPAVDFRNIQEVLVITTTKAELTGKIRRSRGETDMKIIRARRIAVTAAVILVAYVLQCAVFPALAVANIKPNLMLIITASFGFMRGPREGMFVGIASGLLIDIQYGNMIGFLCPDLSPGRIRKRNLQTDVFR